jgi:hypothetical protein
MSDTDSFSEAFAAGACAAYDDCGHDTPPWWCRTLEERAAWRNGLSSGYDDVERLALAESEKRIANECYNAPEKTQALRAVRTEPDYRIALARAAALMDAQPGTAASDELALLTDLVWLYEFRRGSGTLQPALCPPAKRIADLDENGWTRMIRWHEHRAESAMRSLSCGSENFEYRLAHEEADAHWAAAALMRLRIGA